MNYKSYFNGLNCRKFEVKLIKDSGDTYTEFTLASNPFTVNYNVSKTPFDPVRTSTASINVVSDTYMEDIMSPCAQGTRVELWDITSDNNQFIEWVGYLTPKVYDAGYENCFEEFSLEAADCVSSLQYADYQNLSGGGLTNVLGIIGQICDTCGALDGFYWTRSKKVGNTVLLPQHLMISEHNFVSNDTEEPWKLNSVLEELCKYLGFTCLQWGTSLYFVDYQYLETNSNLYMTWYSKANNYDAGSASHKGNPFTVTADEYRSNGANISFEPVYNKVVVNANLYAAEDFIPNPFDDDLLTNRISSANFYTSINIPTETPDLPEYPHGSAFLGAGQGYKKEISGDSRYIYHHRIYDNKYWDSQYYLSDGTYIYLGDEIRASSAITKDYMGGTIVDLGRVKKNYVSETQQVIVPSKMDYTRYLCICEKYNNVYSGGSMNAVFKLKDGYKSRVMLDDKSFLVLDFKCIYERYQGRNYINPDWVNTECSWPFFLAGPHTNTLGKPRLRLNIGDLGWSSSQRRWVSAGTSNDIINLEMEWDSNKTDFWNKDIHILNNVSWQDEINAEGIKIPLSGVDFTQPIKFEILRPNPSFYGNTGNPNFERQGYQYNAYCWVRDLSLKCMFAGQSENGNENDVVYENVISGCSVNELNDITVKVTTYKEGVKPSYSHMVYKPNDETRAVFLTHVKEEAFADMTSGYTAMIPEENIIFKYVHQYEGQTKKISLTLDDTISPLDKLFGVDVENVDTGYVQLGTEIDYGMGRQTITAIEKEK